MHDQDGEVITVFVAYETPLDALVGVVDALDAELQAQTRRRGLRAV